jgi:hypothetical protein
LVGWFTALQAGMSRVRFPHGVPDIFIDLILPAGQPVTEMSTRELPWEVKAAGA